jgi:hypothetical protein
MILHTFVLSLVNMKCKSILEKGAWLAIELQGSVVMVREERPIKCEKNHAFSRGNTLLSFQDPILQAFNIKMEVKSFRLLNVSPY